MLNNCELFLNYVLKENNLKIEDIYENNKIKRPGYERLNLYYMKAEDMEKEIIEWYELLLVIYLLLIQHYYVMMIRLLKR